MNDDDIYQKCTLLRSLHVRKSTALILSALSTHKELTSNEFQNMFKISQSEVSIITNNLSDKGILTYRKTKERSASIVHSYSLALPFNQIVEKLEQKHLIEHRKKLSTLHDLKNIIH
jgi:predicted transcriptional regulator